MARVIVPDLRGFGESKASRSAESIDQYADDLAQLLDQIGIGAEKVTLAGLSMGGYIVFAFLRRYQARVRAVVLADTRANADTDEARQGREKMARLAEEKGPAAIAEQMLPKLLSKNASAELRAKVRRLIEENNREGIAAALRAMATRPDARPQLESITVPTLVIVGSDDEVTPPDAARAMQQAIRGCKLVEIPRAGHLSNLECPEPFTAALLEFWTANERA
jgi:pimeloyl-ACP methyl ester carboxylesterase